MNLFNISIVIFSLLGGLGVIMGFIFIIGRVRNCKEALSLESAASFIVMLALIASCKEYILEGSFWMFILLVFILMLLTFNLGGWIAVKLNCWKSKKNRMKIEIL